MKSEGDALLGWSLKPPRARIGWPALGCMPGHTGCEHLLYNEIVVADAINAM